MDSLYCGKGSTGKPGVWKGRHWQLPQNKPVPQQELLSHICRKLWLLKSSEVLVFCFCKEFAVSCKSLTEFLLLLDVSFKEVVKMV